MPRLRVYRAHRRRGCKLASSADTDYFTYSPQDRPIPCFYYPFYVSAGVWGHLKAFATLNCLGILCYMPDLSHTDVGVHAAQLVSLRRHLISELMKWVHKINSYHADLTFDNVLTAFIVASIGPTEEGVHSQLRYWLSFIKYAVKKSNICVESSELIQEDRE